MSPGFGRGFLRFMGDFLGCFGKSGCRRVVFCSQRVVKRVANVDGGLSFGGSVENYAGISDLFLAGVGRRS